MAAEGEELNPSNLGTKSYWEEQYKVELDNFKDHGDTGEIWFGEDIMSAICTWIDNHIDKSSAILDVGSGNGLLLMDLSEKGYTELTGIDYSQKAIDLSTNLAETRKAKIHFEVCDILADLQSTSSEPLKKKYDFILDKGTYDTISLSPEDAHSKREKYIDNCCHLLKDDGRYLIATCNWTEDEIKEQMTKGCCELVEILPTPVMEFAGKKGHNVTVAIFKKK